MRKRVFAMILTVALCIGLLPTNVLASAVDEEIAPLSEAVEEEGDQDSTGSEDADDETLEVAVVSEEEVDFNSENTESSEEEFIEDESSDEDELSEEDENDIMTLSGPMAQELDGDFAYLSAMTMETGSNDNGYAMDTGTSPWDNDDKPGDDSRASNTILRTFDTATYSVDFTNQVRESDNDEQPGSYYQGDLYFELLVEGTSSQVQWDTGAMGFLEGKNGTYASYEEVYEGSTYQILRGHITLSPATDDGHAIGNSQQTLTTALRALSLKNGDILQPQFTFFMAYNDVGLSEDQYNAWGTSSYNGPIVTFAGSECKEHGETEYKTVVAPPVTISAAPRYNLYIAEGETTSQTVSSFDFGTGNDLAVNKSAGEKYGRLAGFGIELQIVGKSAESGLRGVEIPENGDTINATFNLDLSSMYTANGKSYKTDGTTYDTSEVKTADGSLSDYAPLIWSFEANTAGSTQQDERAIPSAISSKYVINVPYNKLPSGGSTSWYHYCDDGGFWTITEKGNGKYEVTITDCVVNMDQLPYNNASANSLIYTYYNPNNINYDPSDDTKNDYWEVETAVIGTAECWVLQPFYAHEKTAETGDDSTYIASVIDDGTFNEYLKDTGLQVKDSSGDTLLGYVEDNSNQAKIDDDQQDASMALLKPGNIQQYIAYLKYYDTNSVYNDPLVDGCLDNAKDWILKGDQLTVGGYLVHDNAEGQYTGVAYDVMAKFDDAFFEPKECELRNNVGGTDLKNTVLWAAKPDGTGWDHKELSPDQDGYDEEMIYATPDDLVYFSSLEDLESKGYTCVGLLVEYRGPASEGGMNHLHYYIKGTAKTDAEVDQVYMITHYARAWNKENLADTMALDENSGYYGDASGALDAILSMSADDVVTLAKEYIPSHADSNNEYSNGVYPTTANTYWINGGSDGTSGNSNNIRNYKKAYYTENGFDGNGTGVTANRYYGDSCLLVGYKSGLQIQVAQETTSQGEKHSKSTFDMDTGQTVVDYVVEPFITRNNGEGESGAVTIDKEVVVTVTLPKNLTYISGSSYIGGTYETTTEGHQGTVTGGTQLETGVATTFTYTVGGIEYTVGVTLTVQDNSDGTQTLVYTFTDVPISGSEPTQLLENIYFSCEISSGAVTNNDQLEVDATIVCEEDKGIDVTLKDDGEADVGITVIKNSAISLVKTADSVAVDVNGEIGYTMDIGDNSDDAATMVAVDNLPYRGDGSSTIQNETSDVYVTEFSAYDVTDETDLSKFFFFYTTNKEHAGKTSADYPEGTDFVTGLGTDDAKVNPDLSSDWVQITMTTSKDTAGHTVYTATNIPNNTEIYAIVAVGLITGSDDVTMHVTLQLYDAEPGDILENKLTQQHSTTVENEDGTTSIVYNDLTDTARTRIVGRTVSGTVWLDEDMDGGIRTGTYQNEQLLAGVDVELQILQNGSWVTAQKLKTADGESADCKTKTDESGYYEFDYVPEGQFRVVVSGTGTSTAGSGDIQPNALSSYSLGDHVVTTYEASGIDNTVNSKVERDNGTDMIVGIAMPTAVAINGTTEDVSYQNAGYTKSQQLDVSKTWVDANGNEVTEGNGTSEITATVTTSQDSWTVKLNEDNEWTDTIDELWYYDGNGDPVVFILNSNITVTENGTPKKYELKDTQITGNADEGFAVTLENDEVTTEVSGEKTWEDNNNQDGVRPNDITIVLLANGVEYARQTVQADNEGKWTWSFTGLPMYDDNDEEIHYSIAEVTIDDYTTVIDGTNVINTHTPEKTGINVEKLWRDNDNQDGERPDSITVKLLKNGEETGDELILNEDNNWQGSFTDLDKYEPEGQEIEYSVAEITVDGYTTTILPIDDTSTIIISNVHPSATVDISGEKTWDDNDDQDGIRPESITVHLLRDGEEIDSVTVPDDEGNWAWSWEGLPEYHDHGHEYVYTVEEEPVDGYTTDVVNDYDIVNTHVPETIDMSGFKTWDDADDQDGKRPESITINLLADGDIIQTIEVTAENDWKWSFTELPKYKDGGIEIQYQITEDSLEDYDYSTTYGENGEIINSYTPEQTSLTVIKVWDDGNNADKIRAASITVELLKNGDPTGQTIVLTPDDNWTGSFTELDKYTDGKENVYTVQEEDVEGYYSEITGDETSGYVITNMHTPETTGEPGPGPASGGNGGGTKTGDTNNIGLWLALLVAAIAAVLVAVRMRRRS